MKTNHDGTITLNAYDTWTSCVACGQRVTGDSIHTCSPQLKQLTDEEIRHIQAICHLKDVGYDGFIMRFARAILLKVQDLEFEQEGYENLTEMLESEKAELTEKNCQQQAEIDKLKNLLLDNQILLDKTLNAWAKEMERKK